MCIVAARHHARDEPRISKAIATRVPEKMMTLKRISRIRI
jgi:hypothetical protein